MKFNIVGSKFDVSTSAPCPVRVVQNFLDTQKDGDLLPSRDLAYSIKKEVQYLAKVSTHPLLDDYCVADVIKNKGKVWGNKATVLALKKELKRL